VSQGAVKVDPVAKTLTLPYNAAVASLIPEVKVVKDQMVLPHTHDVVRLARNLGLKAPAPIMAQYDWNGGTPFKTQRITAAMLTMNRRAYVLSEMGTGKTRSALYAIDFLIRSGEIDRAIVVAPLSTLTTVWYREVFRYFNHLSVGVLHGDRKRRREILAQDHRIYVINHDGLATVLPELLVRRDIQCVAIDELAAFRNARTARWKAVSALVGGRKYAWGLTGAPTPNEPPDAWAQVKLLTPERVPKYYKQFKEATMMQVSTFRWVPRKRSEDYVAQVMQPAVRFKRDDCVELPPVIYDTREAPLSPEQKRIYTEMMRHMKVAFDQGEVKAANEGVLMSKLLQITTGFVYTKTGEPVEIDNSPRMDALVELVDEAEGKVIVFVDFIHASHMVAKRLKAQGYSVAQVSGETSKKDRDQIFTEFQTAALPRVLVAHPKCMAHGLTLTSANVIVWFSPTTSNETYEQACARITRPSQTRKQLIMHLTGTPVESKLYKRLQQKQSLQGALLELFE
jgi:SNF2 family DNA or RNA helicase